MFFITSTSTTLLKGWPSAFTVNPINHKELKMHCKKLNTSMDAFNEVSQLWLDSELNSGLKYKAFILDKNKKMVLAFITDDIYEVEDDPRKFFNQVAKAINDIKSKHGLDIADAEILFTRNKIGSELVFDDRTTNLTKVLENLAPTFNLKVNDVMIMNSTSYISYRDKGILKS